MKIFHGKIMYSTYNYSDILYSIDVIMHRCNGCGPWRSEQSTRYSTAQHSTAFACEMHETWKLLKTRIRNSDMVKQSGWFGWHLFFHFCSPIPSGVFAHVVHLLRVKSGDSLAIVPAQTHANIATLVVVFHVANSNRLLRWTIKLFFSFSVSIYWPFYCCTVHYTSI